MHLESPIKICFSITITDICNLNCSYCHFYNRKKYINRNTVLEKEIFDIYLKFMSFFYNKNNDYDVQIRFSGGEPLCVKEKLFDFSNAVFNEIGIKPYVLTNGVELNADVINNAVKNNISRFVVSVENPFSVFRGSTHPQMILEKIKQLSTTSLPINLGVCLIDNENFDKISDIASYFYNEVYELPSFLEVTFQDYVTPTDNQLNSLTNELEKIISKYQNINVAFDFFDYTVPELNHSNGNIYIIELDLNNSREISYDESTYEAFFNERLNSNYPFINCEEKDCFLFETCNRFKWVWKDKKKDFCRFKKAVYLAYYNYYYKEKI